METLNGLGIPAGYLNSTQNDDEREETARKLWGGYYKLFYIAPERFAMEEFMQKLRETDISCFVIDEAHCISAWGPDFRPAYRELDRLRELFPETAIHAFTATATPPGAG